jgi:NAD(P)-dependent dehydrogenase (short-subunit alcohol dehydrogenase family)
VSTRVALVTGASRGIGKASAISLAEAGFDVAIAARTVHEGDGRDERHPGDVIPGSLDATAEAIEATGQRALPVVLDLLDRSSWSACVDRVVSAWDRVDVLVNNARHQRHDHRARFADVSIETLDLELQGNLLAPAVLAKLVLPGMIERRSGTIINLTSTAGYLNPPGTAEKGGWSSSYALAKGGLHRLAGMLAVELGDQGINAFNLQPGFVVGEKNAHRIAQLGAVSKYVPAPPAAIGPVVAWLATEDEAAQFNGLTIEGQYFCLERGLYPDWRGDRTGEADDAAVGPRVSVW